MVDIEPDVMVAYKFLHIHKIVRPETIEKGRIGRMDDKQREGKGSAHIPCIQPDIRIAKGRDIPSFGHAELERMVIVLTIEQPFYTRGILKSKDGILVWNREAEIPALIELLMRRPAKIHGQLCSGQAGYRVGPRGLMGIYIIERLRGLLEPVTHTYIVGEVISELMDIIEIGDVRVQPLAPNAATKRAQKGISFGELVVLTGIADIVQKAGLDVVKWILVDGFVIDGISSAYIVFPAPVAGRIGDIVFRKNARAQLGGGPPAELVAAPLQGVERIETADRPYIKRPGGLIA